MSFAPRRMPLGQSQDILQADPGGRVTPRFWHRLNRFRHFTGVSLTLASLNRACWNHVPTFPQRSPPSLLTTAACGGLRSAPDCRTRRALLHLSYSCAAPFGPAILVTQHQLRTSRSVGQARDVRGLATGDPPSLSPRRKRRGKREAGSRIRRFDPKPMNKQARNCFFRNLNRI